jgi:hypothetical protein
MVANFLYGQAGTTDCWAAAMATISIPAPIAVRAGDVVHGGSHTSGSLDRHVTHSAFDQPVPGLTYGATVGARIRTPGGGYFHCGEVETAITAVVSALVRDNLLR